MKLGFFIFLRSPVAVELESLFLYQRKVCRSAGRSLHTLYTDFSSDSHLVLHAICTLVASLYLLFSETPSIFFISEAI